MIGGATMKRWARRLVSTVVRATYEAGSWVRRTIDWNAPTEGPNRAVLQTLTILRDRSRAAVANEGYAKGIIDKLVTNIVGTGIKPLCKAKDVQFRRDLQALWLRWVDVSDADGILDFYGQQSQAVRCWLEAGECFIRLRPRLPGDGLPVPLQIQVLEPEMCPHTHNATNPATGNDIVAGIEFDSIGRRVAYWFHQSRPGDDVNWTSSALRRVPAELVIHLYEPLRAGQLRGVPHLTQALVKLRELDKFNDATLLRQQIGNLFAAYITRGDGDGGEFNAITGLATTDTSGGKPVVGIEAGTVHELGAGEKMEFSKPPDPPATYAAFNKQHLMAVATATGVPYEVFSGDMTGLNDRVMRVVLHEFRRYIQGRQHHIVAFQVCRAIWTAWLTRAYLSDALTFGLDYLTDPQSYEAVKWMPQGWPYIHPVQDVQAAEAAIRAGFTSRSAVVSEQGEDAEVIDEEQAEDNRRADELGLIYESDGRQKKAAPATNAAPPDPNADPETVPPGNADEAEPAAA